MIPPVLTKGLRLPIVAAPMFLVSGPELVAACCLNGVIGTFPALNQRSTAGLAEWLRELQQCLAPHAGTAAAYGVNLIVHKTNPRLEADLEVCVQQRVPLIITSLGAVSTLVERVHSYGGLVFHDVTTLRHAEKAAAAGVDGLILVCAGAGGHAGVLNPFAFTAAVRRFFKGTILLAGCINAGNDIAAAQTLGADLAYMGTRFIATQESRASDEYKQMLLRAGPDDVVYTPAVSGVPGNFLRESLQLAGVDITAGKASAVNLGAELAQQGGQHEDAKAWRDVWSAGQGVAGIEDVPAVAALVTRLQDEYTSASRRAAINGSFGSGH
ncbi:MAG: NAD(P)H-dependent flavin oxidoreductase [Steroidobacteraceae bacterium]